MRRWVGVCALVVAAAGCEGPVCGTGTIAHNGVCEPGSSCALVANSPLTEHTGSGGLPAACPWPADVGGAIPGAIIINRVESPCL